MKRLLTWAVVVMAMTVLCGMIPASALRLAQGLPTHALSDEAANVKLLGRTEVTTSGIVPHTTGAGIAFYSDGGGDITLTVTGSSTKFNAQCFAVYIDGVMEKRLVLEHPLYQSVTETLTVAEGLEAGTHRIEIVRETEEANAQCVFKALSLNGTLTAVPDAPMLIEFVGDSITGGYSALPKTDASMSIEHSLLEAGTHTYAYLTAEALGMDFQACCSSGYGVVCGWNADGANLQTMYGLTAFHHSRNDEWDFARPADIVVINLGTNDNMRMSAWGKTADDIQEGILSLMQQAKEKNPDAAVVWCTGMMGTFFKDEVTACVEQLGGSEAGFYFCELPYGTSGGAGHPNLDEHAVASEALVVYLQENVLPADYADSLVSADEAKKMNTKNLDDAVKAQLETEIAIAENSDALNGVLTGLCAAHDLQSGSGLWWIILAAVAVVAIAAVIGVLLKKKKA